MTYRNCKRDAPVCAKYATKLIVCWSVLSFGCGMLLMGIILAPRSGNLILDALEPCQNTSLVR